MSSRKTAQDYHNLAAKRGFKWLGPEVPNTGSKTGWQCKQGHIWQTKYANIQQGKGCPACYRKKFKKAEDYHNLAAKRGFKWLGPDVPNVRTKTTWQCQRGHHWQAEFNKIQQGKGCPACPPKNYKGTKDYHNLAAKRGFKWLGPEVPNTGSKTGWQCKQGHIWQTKYASIQQGKGCPACYRKKFKKAEDYHNLAAKRGFKWLGPDVPNVSTKTTWQCQRGHHWQAAFEKIQQGKGCPDCAGVRRKTPQDYHNLAQKRQFKWLGPQVTTIKAKTGWQCAQGHQWQTAYSNIYRGTGCPICAKNHPKTAQDYHNLAAKRDFKWLGAEVPNIDTKTDWQCVQGHQWQATYSQVQRGKKCTACFVRWAKTEQDYYDLAAKRGFTWLGPKVLRVVVKTGWQCSQGHQWQSSYHTINQGAGCPDCAGNRPRTAQDYQNLATERGFKWLGPEVPNTGSKTGWQCAKGHYWRASYNSLQQNRGCPDCAGVRPKTKRDYHKLAKKREFKWLGPAVPNIDTKTGWQCEQGHQWQATYDNINMGRGCPDCAGSRLKTERDYYELAKKRGFKWLGPAVPNVMTKTGWQCEQRHQWQASYDSIRAGRGCPYCAPNRPKTERDYHELAAKRDFKWLGPAVPNTVTKTGWLCDIGHFWRTTYSSIQQGKGCRECFFDTLRRRKKKKRNK